MNIISLNTNYCYTYNLNNLVQHTDPGGMLAWLEAELDNLEKGRGGAVIISHIPNIKDCTR